MTKNSKVNILNVSFDNLTQENILKQLNQRMQSQKKTFIVTANPEIVMFANRNPEYMNTLKKADYVVADGIGIVKGARILGTPIAERIAGYDLMCELLKKANHHGYSIYLIGAKEEVIKKTVKKIKTQYPYIEIKGYQNGYFKITNEEVMEKAVREQADIVFVALGFPKQEKWIQDYLKQVPKGLAMGVGGSFDAFTGTVKRAPKYIIRLNLEWLYRLFKQPTRFKRMLMIPKFLIEIFKEKRRSV